MGLVVLLLIGSGGAFAAEPGSALRVGIRDVRPFIFQNSDQPPHGYAIDLWEALAYELGCEFSFVPSDGIASTLQDMQDQKLDIAIGAITITEAREQRFDFSYSYFHTGLGILVPVGSDFSLTTFFSTFFTADRMRKIGMFFLFLLCSAHVIWLAERRRSYSFHRNYFPGIFEGIYWSIVTASTVGYGDYIPKSKTGKMLAVLIIFVSLPLFAVFVADTSSFFTLHKLRSYIEGPQDLDGKRVGVVRSSTSEEYMEHQRLAVAETYPGALDMFKALDEGYLNAVVHDLPTLQYYAGNEGQGRVQVVGRMFGKQDYAFLLPEGSKLKESVDRALLKLIENGTIATIHSKWFGGEEMN